LSDRSFVSDMVIFHRLYGDVEVEWKMLGDIGDVCMCKRIFKSQTSSKGDIPFYKIGTFGKRADAYISRGLFEEFKEKFNYPKVGDVLISASGTIGRTVIFDGEDSYFQDSNIVWIDNNENVALNKFLFYYYTIAKWDTAEGGTIQRLYNDNLKKTIIPIPCPDNPEKSLAIQSEIVRILDAFSTLTHSISEGLPREIELRRKQYEYYRDLLLSFPREIIKSRADNEG
ncbi:restriction endonuclease subunit S, partial [Salmonella enterica]